MVNHLLDLHSLVCHFLHLKRCDYSVQKGVLHLRSVFNEYLLSSGRFSSFIMYSSMDCTSPIHKARSLDVMSKDADSSQTLSCQIKEGGGGREMKNGLFIMEQSTYYVMSLIQYNHGPLYVNTMHAPRLQRINSTTE